ncbi:hypothetical protein [Planktosalinus lacus]|uniref:Uncharacterized protein n=1 Tax=Planktosalinus lacus TaxID=1526573 RepID=A0A8J2VAB8_9FLAO|nr:hypothetical protein [Planktosalinus lacus]GGD91783.1 hypothetical protein GCM10011312_14480 [Planktosalinus lacus]
MNYNIHLKLPNSPLYKKALEIFTLSKSLSQFLVHDMAVLNEKGEEHPEIYYTGDIVQKSSSIIPEIINAEQKKYTEERHKHAASVARLSKLLYKNCERLEHSVPNGKEFIALLRKELKGFRKMQRQWHLSL